jgi:TrmH RNA methyltransferase
VGFRRREPVEPARGRGREEAKLVRIAGLPAVEAVFATTPERIERIYFTNAHKVDVGMICVALAKAHRSYRLVADNELERIAGTAMHGGVVALVTPRAALPFDTAEAAAWAKDREPIIVLDGVGNPHNLGAIARTAAFFGLKRLVLSTHGEQAGPSDAAYRVARGGLEFMRVYRAERIADTLRRLRRDYLVVGAALKRGQSIRSLSTKTRPVCLVVGNEQEGLPKSTLDQCELIVTLEGSGHVQSLNVAAAAAILIHDLVHAQPTNPPSGLR